MPNALVTAALPYANGPLHLGHLVGYLHADAWVRSRRMEGERAWFVCADDTHGTPIMLAAQSAGVSPETFIAAVQADHEADFSAFGVAFDRYDSTNSSGNRQLTEAIYRTLVAGGHIARRDVEQCFDPVAGVFLPDRYVRGACPRCRALDQYGDNCEQCGAAYGPTDLIDPVSVVSGARPERRTSAHLFFDLGHFQAVLEKWLEGDVAPAGVKAKLREWLKAPEGLKAWDISRDAPYFGVPIPGEPGKFFYVWMDAPIGYLSTFRTLCEAEGVDWEQALDPAAGAEIHHFIGKDIVNFHGIFWPAVLQGAGLPLPTRLHVNGYLTVNGAKMSKSRGTFVTARDYLAAGLEPEALRYYLSAKGSGQVEDLDFRLDDFAARVNADVVGKFVNLASRCAGFLEKRFDGRLGPLADAEQFQRFVEALEPIRTAYARNDPAQALRRAMALADEANRTLEGLKPWALAKQEGEAPARQVQAACSQGIQLFRLVAIALKPVLPRTCLEAEAFLRAPVRCWADAQTPLPADHCIAPYAPLFVRVDTAPLAKRLAPPELARPKSVPRAC